MPADSDQQKLPVASALDTARLALRVLAPTVAKGPIIRRPRVVRSAERHELDTAAVRTMQQMRDRYGDGPLMMKLPIRRQAVLLSADHVRRVLDETPDPFSTASSEKRAALAHFEPKGALITQGADRAPRRRLNEEVLEAQSPVHHMAGAFLPVIDEEAGRLLERSKEAGELTWDAFFDTWFTIVRRIVFGNAAREDRETTDLMIRLRQHGNWAFMRPREPGEMGGRRTR